MSKEKKGYTGRKKRMERDKQKSVSMGGGGVGGGEMRVDGCGWRGEGEGQWGTCNIHCLQEVHLQPDTPYDIITIHNNDIQNI